MSETPFVAPQAPAQPAPGTRTPLSAIDVISYLCGLFAFASLALWGFTAWATPWNIVVGIAAPLLAILVWALFCSPRAVLAVHPFVRAVVELLVYVAATMAWWDLGFAWVGIVFGLIAVTTGVIAGRRRLG